MSFIYPNCPFILEKRFYLMPEQYIACDVFLIQVGKVFLFCFTCQRYTKNTLLIVRKTFRKSDFSETFFLGLCGPLLVHFLFIKELLFVFIYLTSLEHIYRVLLHEHLNKFVEVAFHYIPVS